MVSDKTFFAWLDGELDGAESARVEAEVAADERLLEMAAAHRGMQARLKAAFDTQIDAPVPDVLLAALATQPKAKAQVLDFAEAKKHREARHWPSVAQWGAIAATLAIGVLVGSMTPRQRDAAPIEVQGGKMYAASGIRHALDTELASAPSGDVRVGLTFRDQAGTICRSFTASESSGLACREKGRWQLRGLFAVPESQGGDYRMAAGMDPNLAALVDSTMNGEPLDASQERAAQAAGWR
jgi:hypothetical protein